MVIYEICQHFPLFPVIYERTIGDNNSIESFLKYFNFHSEFQKLCYDSLQAIALS